MNGCERCQEELEAVLIGIADADTIRFVRGHLQACPACARQAAESERLLTGLLSAPAPLPMPAGAREKLLASARQVPLEATSPATSAPRPQPTRPRSRLLLWGAAVAGLAAALGLFALNAARPSIQQADVVVNAGNGALVLARSEVSRYPLIIRAPSGELRGVALDQPKPAWYTEGVYDQGKAYLLDAANNRLVVLNVAAGKVERTYPAPGGAAGLAVSAQGVFVKSAASGEMRIFKDDNCFINKLASAAPMPQADYMDAVLPLPGRILTTQHTTGQVFALSANGEQVLATYNVGGAPVGLKSWNGKVLVLDVQGRLLQLGAGGQIERVLALSGHPDKFSLMDNQAYLTDRGGSVSVVDLRRFVVTQRRNFGKPMDIVALPDGHLALADALRGLIMLRPDLSEL